MKVRVSELLNGKGSYWYKGGEIYEVENYTAVSYKVSSGENKGKMIYHGHCHVIER